ncbi:MAG: polyamine ABC transporter substrate-binding protein [Rhodobacteraceae bacterium]|nr:polyamine ABC transporter substrate-binding protein [Paracoccaceae bacterium]
MMTRLLSLTLVSVALASPVAAQQTLNIYNWSDYIAEDTITKFEEATGIKVVYDVYDSNEVLEAKLLAGSSGYDLVVPTSNFLQRQVKAGIYMPLDKAKIPNLGNLDPGLMKSAAAYDAGNAHSAIYLWGTTGIGYNIDKVAERLGDAAPTDSWSLVLDPANAAKLADCGISILDSAVEVMPGVLAWLGLPPDSTDPDDIEKAMAALTAIRPYVRYFHSSQYITDLANGEVCLSIGWSGDVFIAMDRAAEAGNGVNIGYTIPSEGTLQWFDMMAIPADAPHPDAAHAFINFVLQPEIIADITNYVFYPNAVPASKEMIDPEITGDPAIYPPQEVLDKLFPATVYDARTDRLINRLWTQVRTGQ